MYIFTLLGNIIDGLWYGDIKKNRVQDGVDIEISDHNIINKYILPVCEDSADNWQEVIENDEWYTVTLNFRKNPHKNELKSITFTNSLGQNAICEVGDNLLDLLCYDYLDSLYFELCSEIML